VGESGWVWVGITLGTWMLDLRYFGHTEMICGFSQIFKIYKDKNKLISYKRKNMKHDVIK